MRVVEVIDAPSDRYAVSFNGTYRNGAQTFELGNEKEPSIDYQSDDINQLVQQVTSDAAQEGFKVKYQSLPPNRNSSWNDDNVIGAFIELDSQYSDGEDHIIAVLIDMR